MARLFFGLWPIATMKIRPISFKFCNNENSPNIIQILQKFVLNFPEYKINPQKWPKNFKTLPLWQNFVKSGRNVFNPL